MVYKMRVRTFIFVAIGGLFLAVNGLSVTRAAEMGPRDRVKAYIAQHSDLAPGVLTAMTGLRLAAGMTEEQVRVTWGEPVEIIRYAGGHEKWLFSCDRPHPCRRKGPPGSRRWVYKSKPSALLVRGRVTDWNR